MSCSSRTIAEEKFNYAGFFENLDSV